MQLAQINLAKMRAPLDDPVMADFVANLERINALAEGAPGFVWRLVGDGVDVTSVPSGDEPGLIVNLSVWRDVAALREFTYRSPHLEFVKRRREWFDKLEVFLAMWWIDDGHRPSVSEGRARLAYLATHGSTKYAFTFAKTYEPDGAESPAREWPPHTPRNAHLPDEATPTR